jgi:hypothetical protein
VLRDAILRVIRAWGTPMQPVVGVFQKGSRQCPCKLLSRKGRFPRSLVVSRVKVLSRTRAGGVSLKSLLESRGQTFERIALVHALALTTRQAKLPSLGG